jgi:hypothetical protein
VPEIGTQGVYYPNYEERRDSLLEINQSGNTPIKVATTAKKPPEPEEPMYDHRSQPKERPRPPRGHPDTTVYTVYMNVGGTLAHCLLDSGSEGVMIAADYVRATRLPIRRLVKPVTLQLACQGSRSMINHGVTTRVEIAGNTSEEYFDVANIDYYDVIIGVPFLRRYQISLDFANGEIKVGNQSYKPGSTISLTGKKTSSVMSATVRKN